MQREIEALLALQEDDQKIRDIESQLKGLEPRLAELEKKREQAAGALTRAQSAVQAEEKKQREIQGRLAQHKQLQERNLHQLDDVKRMREATAATAQVESTRRLMAEDEAELQAIARRLDDLNAAVTAASESLAAIEKEKEEARPAIDELRKSLHTELGAAKKDRESTASAVSRPMLGKYDRIRGRRDRALYPLRGGSCGNCDTSVPLQQRNMMTGSKGIEVCEACGVLLYVDGA